MNAGAIGVPAMVLKIKYDKTRYRVTESWAFGAQPAGY